LPPDPEEAEELEVEPLVELADGAGCGAGFGLLPWPVSAPTMLLTV
jgi:hypothetical protein